MLSGLVHEMLTMAVINHTSRRSGLRFLYSTLACEEILPRELFPLGPVVAPFDASPRNTVHAFEGTPPGDWSAAILSFLIVAAFFCASVKTFRLGFAFAFAFFAGFGFGLIRSFAFDLALDLALGFALGVLVFEAGFLAAFVFEVVGAFLAAVVVLPV